MSNAVSFIGAKRLAGRAGVVTGAGRGIGRAIALRLVQEGAAVVVVDIAAEPLTTLVADIAASGGMAQALGADVSDEASIAAMIALCRDAYGRYDYVIQNAAVQVEKHLHDTTGEDWDRLMSVNLKALFWGCKYSAMAMMESGGGSIVNLASALSFVADPILAAYSTAKHGVLGLTRAVGTTREYARRGVRCNCIAPGDMLTPMVERYWAACPDPAAARQEMERHYPTGRIGLPDEVAAIAAFLVSDDSSLINATAIVADGGLTAQCYS